MANFNRTITLSTTTATITQNVAVNDTITVTVQSNGGYTGTASVSNQSTSVCSISSTSVSIGSSFVITANATGTIDVDLFLVVSKQIVESGTVTGTVSTASDTTPENFTNLGGSRSDVLKSTYYYATFSTSQVGEPVPGIGFAIGTQVSTGTSISASNGQWSTDGTNWNTSGTVTQNTTVYYRGLSSSSNSATLTHSLTIGDTTRSFQTTTAASSGTTPVAPTSVTASHTQINNLLEEDSTASPNSPNDSNVCVGYRIRAAITGGTGTIEYQYSGVPTTGSNRPSYTSFWTDVNYFDVGGEWGKSTWTVKVRAVSGGTSDELSTGSSTTLPTTKPYFGTLTLNPTTRAVTSTDTQTTFTVSVDNPNMGSFTDYDLRQTSTSNVLGSREGEGTITVLDSVTGWPSSGSTTNFQVRGVLPSADGGDGLYDVSTVSGSIENTGADRTPDEYYFDSETNVTPGSGTYVSDPQTITGIDNGTSISITGTGSPEYSINSTSSAAFTSSTGTINNNDVVRVRVTAPSSYGATNTGTLTIGSGSTSTVSYSVSTTISSGTGGWGLEIRGPNGNSIVFSPDHRTFNRVDQGVVTLQPGNTYSITGVPNATDDTKVLVSVYNTGVYYLNWANFIQITRSTANGGTITFGNSSSNSTYIVFGYNVERIG